MGLPVVMESTFLQLFLKNLGASSFLVGLIPTLLFLGISIFSLFSGFFTAHLENKRNAVILLHLFASIPMLIFGIFLKTTGFVPGTLGLFFTSYAFFSVGIGLTLPTWQNYLVKLYSGEKIISGHSIMWIFQSIGKFLSGFVILKVISKYSFTSSGASLIFIFVGITFIAGSLTFLLTKESPSTNVVKSTTRVNTRLYNFKRDVQRALHNRNFLFLLGSDFEQYAVVSIMAFYANYAAEFHNIKPSVAAGVFVIFSYSGTIAVNIIFGWFKLLSLKNKYLCGKFFSLAAVLILIFSPGLGGFLAASFLMGSSRGTRTLVYLPAIRKISGQADSTNFFSVAPILLLPLSAGLPLLTGAFLDHSASLGDLSYKIMFFVMIGFILAGIYFLKKVDLG